MSGSFHVVTPVGASVCTPPTHAVPFQYRPSAARCTVTATLATAPGAASAAVPQMPPAGVQPAGQVVALYAPPAPGKVMATVGAVVSTMNVAGALKPVFPPVSLWLATAVY